MIEVHLLLPPEVIKSLGRFSLIHKNKHFGYFTHLTLQEFWTLAANLVASNYRIDITPGMTYKLVARKI